MWAPCSPHEPCYVGMLSISAVCKQWMIQLGLYPLRCLNVRSRKVSKPGDWVSKSSHLSAICQALRQHCCQNAGQISERSDNTKPISPCFQMSWDLTVRHLTIQKIEALVPLLTLIEVIEGNKWSWLEFNRRNIAGLYVFMHTACGPPKNFSCKSA